MNRGVAQTKFVRHNAKKFLSRFQTVSFLGFFAALTFAQQTILRSDKPKPDLLIVQAPMFVPGRLPQRFPQGSRIVRVPWGTPSAKPINLTAQFFAVADPQPSFDASRILFSGQTARGGLWQVWEMNADGSNARQITHCAEECLHATYLPGDEIVLTASRQQGKQSFTNLEVVRIDGADLHPITLGRANFELETVLRDGRILASASWPLLADSSATAARSLYTLRPDGAGLDSLRCDHDGTATRGDAVELDDGTILFIKSSTHGNKKITELAQIQPAAVHESTLRIAASTYRFPAQLLPGTLLISNSHRPVGEKSSASSVYTFHPKTRTLGDRIAGSGGLANIQAVPLAPHAVPKKFWSILNLDSPTASFISLNSASSGDEPGGHIPEAIARVRVSTLVEDADSEKVLGEAPVEADGSFFVEVPANQPVRFELLSEAGRVLRAERGWIWARPGEQRGCAGCHASKAYAPENHWPLTLKRFDTPSNLAAPESAAARGKVN
jgi:Hydrazine synthase alpha subunit middle domain